MEKWWAGKHKQPSNCHWEDWSDSFDPDASVWPLTLKCRHLRCITCRTLRSHCGFSNSPTRIHFQCWQRNYKYFHMRWALTIASVSVSVSVCTCTCVCLFHCGRILKVSNCEFEYNCVCVSKHKWKQLCVCVSVCVSGGCALGFRWHCVEQHSIVSSPLIFLIISTVGVQIPLACSRRGGRTGPVVSPPSCNNRKLSITFPLSPSLIQNIWVPVWSPLTLELIVCFGESLHAVWFCPCIVH